MPRGGSNPRDEFDQMTGQRDSDRTFIWARHKLAGARIMLGACAVVMLSTMGVPTAMAQEDGDKVLNGENVNPNETYNLPPNFDPDYRPKRTPRNIKVTIDFRQAQLEEVVKFYSSMMNKNFIIDDTLQASKTITIISPKPVSINQAYQAFLAALEMNGLTIVPYGSFLKIVSSKTAKQVGGEPIGAGERIPNEARMVTAIIPVENASVDDMQKIIQQFTSPDATIITYGSSFIITDYGHNLRRVQRLIDRLDKSEASDQLYVYKVLHAEATEIQAKLTEIFEVQQANSSARSTARRNTARRNTNAKANNGPVDAGGDSSSDTDVEISEIIADERTNQLIILTNERSFGRIRQMIELLDVPTTAGGQIHVKFLEYANADDLASTLSSLASGSTNNRNTRNTRSARPTTTTTAPGGNGGSTAQLLQGDVQITSYRPSNSLIIVASPRDYLALERVIGLLDRPRRQVYVEAVIMELNFKDDLNVGLSYNALAPKDFEGVIPESAVEDGIVTDTNGGIIFKTPQSPDTAGGLLALLGPAINIPGISNLGLTPSAFAVYLQATQREDNINILSTPSLMTLDNEEAEIVVGDRVPFPRVVGAGGLGNLLGAAGTGATGTSAAALGGLLGGGLLGNQVQYEDVGITLRITPQVNESKYVRLEVDQEVSSIGAPSDLGPTRSKRSIRTIVLVKDQSTVVIGGLIRDDENETETKVPFMGDIPVIGVLFRSKNTVKTKQNLILMLTPYIIEGESDLRKIHERKRKEREELLKLFQKRDIDYMKTVNYEKKGGLVDRMRDTIGDAIDEETARKEALEAFEETGPRYRILGVPTGSAGVNGGDDAGDGDGGADGGADGDAGGQDAPAATDAPPAADAPDDGGQE